MLQIAPGAQVTFVP